MQAERELTKTVRINSFIGAHLAAHDSGLADRQKDYNTILSSLVFEPSSTLTGPEQMQDSSHVFLLGDLNYRLSQLIDGIGYDMHELSLDSPQQDHSENLAILKEREQLVMFDTLRQEQAKGNVMVGLREGDLGNFAPTYKRFVGEVGGWNKKRVPGYTDRVLFASYHDRGQDEEEEDETSRLAPVPSAQDGRQTEVLAYDSISSITASDHKPVYAIVLIPAPQMTLDTNLHRTPSIRSIPRVPPTDNFQLLQRKFVGTMLDKLAGHIWLLLLALGGGQNPFYGLIVLLVVLLVAGPLWSYGFLRL